MSIKCIIVDDEPLAVEILEAYVEKLPYIQLVGTFNSSLTALQYLKGNRVDLVLLDIQMPELTGFQLVSVLDNPPLVIFITAYDQYAIKSYELEAVDYLLKPVGLDRFIKAIDKVQKRLEGHLPVESQPNEANQHREPFLFIKSEYRIQRIEKSEILYIEGMKNYLRVVTRTEKFMTLQSFKNIQEFLPEPHFVRVHKSFIVALDKIDFIECNRIRIGDAYIPIGDTYKKDLDRIIEGLNC